MCVCVWAVYCASATKWSRRDAVAADLSLSYAEAELLWRKKEKSLVEFNFSGRSQDPVTSGEPQLGAVASCPIAPGNI